MSWWPPGYLGPRSGRDGRSSQCSDELAVWRRCPPPAPCPSPRSQLHSRLGAHDRASADAAACFARTARHWRSRRPAEVSWTSRRKWPAGSMVAGLRAVCSPSSFATPRPVGGCAWLEVIFFEFGDVPGHLEEICRALHNEVGRIRTFFLRRRRQNPRPAAWPARSRARTAS